MFWTIGYIFLGHNSACVSNYCLLMYCMLKLRCKIQCTLDAICVVLKLTFPFFCIRRVPLICWFWWNWWPSMFKLSFHNSMSWTISAMWYQECHPLYKLTLFIYSSTISVSDWSSEYLIISRSVFTSCLVSSSKGWPVVEVTVFIFLPSVWGPDISIGRWSLIKFTEMQENAIMNTQIYLMPKRTHHSCWNVGSEQNKISLCQIPWKQFCPKSAKRIIFQPSQ